MKIMLYATATAAAALLGGAAYAQQPQPAPAPTPGSVTGDWNGAHAPTDDKQYQDKVRVPLGTASNTAAEVGAPPASEPAPAPAPTTDVTAAPAAPTAGTDVSATSGATFTNLTVTNGPVPDTAENRRKYGQPLSHAGKRTAAKGN